MSKKVFEHPAAQPGEPTGPSYWRSLEERNKSPEFRTRAAREFFEGASTITSVARGEFLMLMGASFGLAGLGLAGCREPPQPHASLRQAAGEHDSRRRDLLRFLFPRRVRQPADPRRDAPAPPDQDRR
jgi:MoCo/4Fe-4S cofactor protein with predicted Tat translocation signal